MYDIIGDVHGHYDLLVKLLKKLGYQSKEGHYYNPNRKVVFTGDIINRGPQIRQTVSLVRAMVEKGAAYAVMGNHELNAILYHTVDKSGKSLRKKLLRYKLPLLKTIQAYDKEPGELKETIKWFRQLPLYLDLGEIRVVHGAWSDKGIQTVSQFMNGESRLKKSFIRTYLNNDELSTSVNTLIKGEEMFMPKDLLVKDDRGLIQRSFRIKWWEPMRGKTFYDAGFGNRFLLPKYTIPLELVPEIAPYDTEAPPVFVGHYCLENKPLIYNGNVCCIDTCITRTGHLAAYRWNGEQKLNAENIITI